MDPSEAKKVLRLFTYGLYVVTSGEGDDAACFTANWIGQVSFEPRMVSLAVEHDAYGLTVIRRTGTYAVNVYESDQRQLAADLGRPTSRVGSKLPGHPFHVSSTGSPLLDEALGSVECRVVHEHAVGDHVLLVGEVVDAHFNREGEPLAMREAGFRYSG